MNVDLKNIACFGFTLPREESWYMVLHKVNSSGWKSIDMDAFQKTLNENVLGAYQYMVNIQFRDIDTDTEYLAVFDNQKKMWKLEIPGSDDDAVSPDDKKAFFKDEQFKRTCKRAEEILKNALKSCEGMIMPEVEKGKFIDVDEVKLEAILDMIKDPSFMKNLKMGKYIH